MTAFDPVKALKEELEALAGVTQVVSAARRDAEHRMGIAEAQLNAYAKMEGWLKVQREALMKRKDALEEELKSRGS